MTPEERGEKAASLKKSGTANCCQSVLLAYADSLPMDEEALRRIGAGFAVGMGTMEATCGALVAAGVVAGHRAATRQEAVQLARAEALQREGKIVEGDGWLAINERPLQTGDISVRKQNGRVKRIGGQVAMNVHLLDCPSYFTRDYFDKIFA